MDDNDARDVAEAREGSEAAFRRLVERHSCAVFRLAFRLTGSEPDADDVVQETFLRAYRQLTRFQSRSSFKTWLHRITVNCAYDVLRQRLRHRADPIDTAATDAGADGIEFETDAAFGPDRVAFGAEIRERVRTAMDLLTPTERAAFVLRHFEGRSLGEIGDVLGLRTGATKHSIFRAVQKMRRALSPVVEPAAGPAPGALRQLGIEP